MKQNIKLLIETNLPDSAQNLIKSLPKELKDLLFKQWVAKQNPEWHPEGNTLKHIIVVLKRAYHHYPDDPNMIMAALFHDLGKIDTYQINPKTGQPTAYGHENKSTEYVEQYRSWIEGFEGTDVDEIKYLVQNHMKVKPSTWDSMKDTKKEPIRTNKSFDKLMGFTDKLDGGGTEIEKKKLQEQIDRIHQMMGILNESEVTFTGDTFTINGQEYLVTTKYGDPISIRNINLIDDELELDLHTPLPLITKKSVELNKNTNLKIKIDKFNEELPEFLYSGEIKIVKKF